MRFTFTIGRMTIFDFKLFEIDDDSKSDPDILVVHHTNDEDDENDGPGDLFGKNT